MPATDLLIDGYNLLHAAGLGRARYGPGDLQRARQSLLRRLFELLTPEEVSHAAVVFDARQPPPHLPALWYIHGLRVVYAQPHGDADLILEELIDEHSAPQRLTVVSSDHRLHRAAKARRASAVDSGEFLDFLNQRRSRPSPARIPEPPPPATKTPAKIATQKGSPQADLAMAELAYWMSVFGEVKVSDLADPPRPAKRLNEPQSGRGEKPAHSSPPLPARKRRTSKQPPAASPEKPAPELFSTEWIAELQRWADQQQ